MAAGVSEGALPKLCLMEADSALFFKSTLRQMITEHQQGHYRRETTLEGCCGTFLMDEGYPSHPLGEEVIQVSHAGGKGRSRAIFYIYRVCLKEVLLSQSHSSKKDKNLDGHLGKTSQPTNPLKESFWKSLLLLPSRESHTAS